MGLGRRRKRGVRAACLASGRGRRSRGQWHEGRAGCCAGGCRSRRLLRRRERIVLDCFGNLGGSAVVCRRDGAGHRGSARRAARQCQSPFVCAGERGEQFVSPDAIRGQHVPGVAGFTATGATYNLATGLGSVDAALLVNNWNSLSNPPTLTLTATAQSVTVSQGGSAVLEFTAATGGSFAGAVSFSVSGLPAGVAAAWSANPVVPSASSGTNHVTLTLTAAQGSAIGYFPLVILAAGDGLTSEQSVTLFVQPRLNACSRFGLLPARCAPLPRAPIRLFDPPYNSAF